MIDREKDLGITSHRLAEYLRQRAETERNISPHEPRIHCAHDGCGNWAEEAWYFCSTDCRNAFLRDRYLGDSSEFRV